LFPPLETALLAPRSSALNWPQTRLVEVFRAFTLPARAGWGGAAQA